MYGIVKQSGGYIWVYSEPGHGSIFKIYFPQVEAPPAERAAAAGLEKKPSIATSTVLLVEDEQVLLEAEAAYLRSLGYKVLCATSGPEAIEMGNDNTPRVDVLVTDVVLPGASGRRVAEAVTRSHPTARVIFMSGYTSDTSLLKQISAEESFLQKPFTLSALAMKIEQVLRARTG